MTDELTRNAESLNRLVARCIEELDRGGSAGVDRICAENTYYADGIRARLEWLRARGFLSGGDHSQVPQYIGPYRIEKSLGEGGMGVVYAAEQLEPVRRRVALKVIKPGMDSRNVLARFALERRALAAMNHSNIAKVLDAGATPSGQSYFVMELVEGSEITRYCDDHRFGLEERIAIFRDVCAGVQHAHQKGVMHRDLKPANVLVTREGDRHVPKIVDFGLAKATNRELLAHSICTEHQLIVGTPEYMAPEQALLDGEAVDARADIYSLGVVLYEILTGSLPFPSNELRGCDWAQIQHTLAEVEPKKPSTKVQLAAEIDDGWRRNRRTTRRGLARDLRGDLDWIVLKAMAKQPERRYDSATGLARDLDRYLQHEPVLAGPPSAGYRLSKLARKYRVQFTAGTAAMLVLCAGAIGTMQFALESNANAEVLRQRTEEFETLKHVVYLDKARAAAVGLHPAWPNKIGDLETWITAHGDRLRDALPHLRRTFTTLQSRLDSIETDAPRPAGLQKPQVGSARFLRDTLKTLIEQIEKLAKEERREIEHRLTWASRIDELTRSHPNARVTWQEVGAAIARADGVAASKQYRELGIKLRPQVGLVPIGKNPATGLFEFYHLRSAYDPDTGDHPAALEIPVHRPDGSIEVTAETGIVFVLLPGGTFIMGAQAEDPDGPNYSDRAESDETPHQERVRPLFVARHELTQGQWIRLGNGGNPSILHRGSPRQRELERGGNIPISLVNPVEGIDWLSCRSLLREFGLALPSEADWEYACRGGTETAWYPGKKAQDIEGFANVLDGSAKRQGVGEAGWVEWDDGYPVHAPVGSFAPNKFGLFDMLGNVREWCEDRYPPRNHVLRGGSFASSASRARTSARDATFATNRKESIGVRAIRRITL